MSNEKSESAFLILNSLVSTKLTKKADSHLSYHGVSFTEYMIMHFLNESPQKTMRRIELAESVGISASGVTRLLAPMEKIGIVEKEANPRDARVSLVKLGKTGQKLYQDASVSFEHCAKSLLSSLTASQLNKLYELSAKLL